MARFTERVRFTVPKTVKDGWKAQAAQRGLSLSAFLRGVTEDLIAEHDFDVFCAELELKRGATVQ